MIRTVLFDLDDTVFDHKHSRMQALRALKSAHDSLSRIPLLELEKEHEIVLAGNYASMLDGALTPEDARTERIFLLFRKFGTVLSQGEATRYSDLYNRVYEQNRRAVPGVKKLMQALKPTVQIGVVSNGLYEIQVEKVRVIGAGDLINFMIFSEDVGARKPERAIFEAALERSGSSPANTVFIGDSLESDIRGAFSCGIRTVWLNRYKAECPEPCGTYEIRSFADTGGIMSYIFAEEHPYFPK
jgi:HAD superfamily hydrolase (TIGR01549 family)